MFLESASSWKAILGRGSLAFLLLYQFGHPFRILDLRVLRLVLPQVVGQFFLGLPVLVLVAEVNQGDSSVESIFVILQPDDVASGELYYLVPVSSDYLLGLPRHLVVSCSLLCWLVLALVSSLLVGYCLSVLSFLLLVGLLLLPLTRLTGLGVHFPCHCLAELSQLHYLQTLGLLHLCFELDDELLGCHEFLMRDVVHLLHYADSLSHVWRG